MRIRIGIVWMILSLLTACTSSDESQLIEEYEVLSAQKKALTDEMVSLNMAINEAESQNDEILTEVSDLEVLLSETRESIEALEETTGELSEEAGLLSETVATRKNLVNGWQLYHSAPKLVLAQPDLNSELETFAQVIRTGYELEYHMMDGGWFPHGSTANEGVTVSEDSTNRWYRLQSPYATKTDLMVWLMDGYTSDGARVVYEKWVTQDPEDTTLVLLEVDGYLYTTGMKSQTYPIHIPDWDEARFFVTELKDTEGTVRMIMPVMDYGDGPWTGTASDMHFIDRELILNKTDYGWRLNGADQ